MSEKYDVIILGAGPAGLTSATYASRANLKVLILDRGIYGGQMNDTAEIENYTGFNSILGSELAEKMYESSTQFGAEYAFGTVEEVVDHGEYKTVKTDMETYEAKVLVIATGAEHSKIVKPGEEEYAGRGVSYCAVCDGAFFQNEHIVVVGGGDSAIEEGLYLANLASKVTIVHRRNKLKAAKIAQSRAFANEKIEFNYNSAIEEIIGDGETVTGVNLIDTQTGEKSHLDTAGVFVYVGIKPNTQGLEKLGILDADGWIPTNDRMETKIPGVFAVGDVRQGSIRQIASAVGDGAEAGKQLFEYIQELQDLAA